MLYIEKRRLKDQTFETSKIKKKKLYWNCYLFFVLFAFFKVDSKYFIKMFAINEKVKT
jgi:hypothetical protein